MDVFHNKKVSQGHKREKAVVYALGECWKEYADIIMEIYDVIACSDRDEKASAYSRGKSFINPNQISSILYDKIILGCSHNGVREIIAIQYGLPVEKIFYCDEVLKKNTLRRKGNKKRHSERLTVVIPTYNREQRLKRTLDILEIQSDVNFDIIILDNCSNYDVAQVLDKRKDEFKGRVKIVYNKTNIGMALNLANAFIQKMDGWVWMLTDDDIPSVYAVEDIYEEIEHCHRIGVIHFSICEWDRYMDHGYKDFKSLHELMEFYQNSTIDWQNIHSYSGDFIYFSNKVYNMKYVQAYYEKIFFYAYSSVPQLVPLLFMLNEESSGVRISNKKIVIYDTAAGDHWDWIKTMSGMRIISDFPLDLDIGERKTLYRVIMGTDMDILIKSINKSDMEFDIRQIEKIYDEIYQYSLNEEERHAYQSKIRELKETI